MRITRVVVTGGREFSDGARIEADLRALLPFGLCRVAQGGHGVDKQLGNAETPARLKSADTLAWVATHRLRLTEATYEVDVQLDGRWPVCGPRRNRRMLDTEKPDLVLAYPDPASKGTWSCVEEAWRWRIPVLVWVSWAKSGNATRIVIDALKARCVNLVWATRQIAGVRVEDLGVTDRDGHRVLVGDPRLADSLPQELD